MTRMRAAIWVFIAGALIAAGVFHVVKELFAAQRLPKLMILAAAGLAGLGSFWLWIGSVAGQFGHEE
jgi:hypothetical protein